MVLPNTLALVALAAFLISNGWDRSKPPDDALNSDYCKLVGANGWYKRTGLRLEGMRTNMSCWVWTSRILLVHLEEAKQRWEKLVEEETGRAKRDAEKQDGG